MSTLASAHFDDSEDEDDNFNPAPADSQTMKMCGDPITTTMRELRSKKEAARRSSRDDCL